eukprot:TRINITY_DN3087_c0_g1_i15.p1 TRINITY_DN3087_c0_g1~~TRINITY_DN3087_c0_g1_i15.p1  ORF type:complete len:351 (+),score=-30.55 TRINITY_DN3087_c0_g1_i15:135-1187(+)
MSHFFERGKKNNPPYAENKRAVAALHHTSPTKPDEAGCYILVGARDPHTHTPDPRALIFSPFVTCRRQRCSSVRPMCPTDSSEASSQGTVLCHATVIYMGKGLISPQLFQKCQLRPKLIVKFQCRPPLIGKCQFNPATFSKMPIQPNHFCENSNSTQPLMYTSAHTPHTSGGMPPSQNTMVGTGDTFFTIEALHDALTIQAAEQQRTLKRTMCESTRTTHICGSDDSDESCPYRVTASLQEGEVVVHLHAEHTCTAAHHKRKTYGETTTLGKEFAGVVRENPRMTPSHMRALLGSTALPAVLPRAARMVCARHVANNIRVHKDFNKSHVESFWVFRGLPKDSLAFSSWLG